MTAYGDYVAFARRLAGEAAALIADNFLGSFAVDRKGTTNLVTEVDRRSEELLVEANHELSHLNRSISCSQATFQLWALQETSSQL